MKRWLYERATLPMWRFSKESIERRFRVQAHGALRERARSTRRCQAVQRAEDLIVAVTGGAGKHSAYIPTFGATKSVTRALKRADGTPARSVADFRKA